jgi:hypothetical protein
MSPSQSCRNTLLPTSPAVAKVGSLMHPVLGGNSRAQTQFIREFFEPKTFSFFIKCLVQDASVWSPWEKAHEALRCLEIQTHGQFGCLTRPQLLLYTQHGTELSRWLSRVWVSEARPSLQHKSALMLWHLTPASYNQPQREPFLSLRLSAFS